MEIEGYSYVAPILWRLMGRVARGVLRSGIKTGASNGEIQKAIDAADKEYQCVRGALCGNNVP